MTAWELVLAADAAAILLWLAFLCWPAYLEWRRGRRSSRRGGYLL